VVVKFSQSTSEGEFSTLFVKYLLALSNLRSQRSNPKHQLILQPIFLNEINLPLSQDLELLEVFMLNMNSSSDYVHLKGKAIYHISITIIASINNVILSNAILSLISKH
jgi:hypothetical protein